MLRQLYQRLCTSKNVLHIISTAKLSSDAAEKRTLPAVSIQFYNLIHKNTGIITDNFEKYSSVRADTADAIINFRINKVLPIGPSLKLPLIDPLKPTVLPFDILEPNLDIDIRDPLMEKPIKKEAARGKTIRNRKMKKHQLKKLRKRMLKKWAHRRLLREQKKEKIFQAELMAQIKEAEMFDAENWATDIIERSNRYRKQKEEEAFYETDEGLKVKLKLIEERKRIKPDWWKD